MSSSSSNVLLAGAVGALCGAAAVAAVFAARPEAPSAPPAKEDSLDRKVKEWESLPAVKKDRHGGVGSEHPSVDNPLFGGCVYLDNNATTPVYPEVADAMWPYLTDCFGNPSSNHAFSLPCKRALQESREAVAALVNAAPDDRIVFTGCGSESDNRAIDIALDAFRHKHHSAGSTGPLPRVLSSEIEHPAILVYLKDLRSRGEIGLDLVAVDPSGAVSVGDVQSKLGRNTALVTIMHSNNEIGTIQPIAEICRVVKAFDSTILVHTDAAQSIGKTAVDAQVLGVDMMTIVGHKFGAPKGIAALYLKSDVVVHRPLLVGGGQEGGLRSGTECMPLIVAIAEASRIARRELACAVRHYIALRLKLVRQLIAVDEKLRHDTGSNEPCVRFNGPPAVFDPVLLERCCDDEDQAMLLSRVSLLNTVSVSVRGHSGHALVAAFGEKEIACSAGSACHTAPGSNSATAVMSYVLRACGVPPEFGLGTLRLSMGRHTTHEDINIAALLLFFKLTGGEMN